MVTRQMDILVPVWGKEYCKDFLDQFLTSMMTPNNLPLLDAKDGHRLLLATTQEDWEFMNASEIFGSIQKHITPTKIDITDAVSKISGQGFARYTKIIEAQTVGQRLMIAEAYKAKSLMALYSPDFIFKDGLIHEAIVAHEAGYNVLLCLTARHNKEKIDSCFAAATFEECACQLHPEMGVFNQNEGRTSDYLPYRYWSFPEGILFHTYYAVMAMADMTKVGSGHLHLTNIECEYFGKNFSPKQMSVITRPMILSLAPANVNWSPKPTGKFTSWWQEIKSLRLSMDAFAKDMPIKQELFERHIRWNHKPISKEWIAKEKEIELKIDTAKQFWVEIAIDLEWWLKIWWSRLNRLFSANGPEWAFNKLKDRLT